MRTLFMEVVFQTIILFSLVEEDASLLVTVPAGVGVLIQVQKYLLSNLHGAKKLGPFLEMAEVTDRQTDRP